MIPRSCRFLLPPVLAGVLFSSLAGAPPADPGQILRAATDQVLAIIYDLPADGRPLAKRAQPVLEKYFNFESLTRRAVGPGWRQLTPAQQQRTTTLLAELVVRSYCSHFDTTVRSRVTYGALVATAAGRCELPTTVTYSDKNFAVAYRAELMPEGWRFYDVIVEGVSLVANYRAQFTELFQKGGADAIISALEKNLAENPPA
jgi:phospholipid transport system substrate-binding protein